MDDDDDPLSDIYGSHRLQRWWSGEAAAEASRVPPLPELLGRASRGFASVADEDLLPTGLTCTQFQVMTRNLVLGYSGVSELADALGMAPATVSGVVRRLEAGELVEREESYTDARVKGVRVTRRGHEVLRRARRSVEGLASAAVSGLSREEVGELERLLVVVVRNLGRERARRDLRPRSDSLPAQGF